MDVQYLIREATLQDSDAILACIAEAFADYRDRYTAPAYLDTVLTPESLCERFRTMRIFVAVNAGGEIAGTIGCSFSIHGEGHLRGLAVRPKGQRSGVAGRLLEAAEAHLFGSQCSRITLDTTAVLEDAIRFYENRGYRRSGRISDFFGMALIEYVKSGDP